MVDACDEDVILFTAWWRPVVCANHINLGHISKRLRLDYSQIRFASLNGDNRTLNKQRITLWSGVSRS
jgi:hypothetical protein